MKELRKYKKSLFQDLLYLNNLIKLTYKKPGNSPAFYFTEKRKKFKKPVI